jgi:phage repressor protein C with HTH and peptisase S24 domain
VVVQKKNITGPIASSNTPGERIRQLRTALGLTGEAFGQGIGITKGSVSSWENNTRFPDGPSLIALQYVYKVNPAWLIEGNGSMWAEPQPTTTISTASDQFLDRPLIVGAATCGAGGEIQDPGPAASRYALRRDFAARILHRCGGGQEQDLFFLLCEGESMQPTILHKEIVLINTAMVGRLSPRSNAIYLVRRSPNSNDARVKRVRLDTDRYQLVLSSDNRAYAPATIDLDGIPLHQVILGRVCWVGRYLLDTDPPEGDW